MAFRSSWWPLAVWFAITLACALGSAALFLVAAGVDREADLVRATWRPVEARVIDSGSRRNADDGSITYWATVEYIDDFGARHELQDTGASPYREERYEVFYDPAQPAAATWAPPGRTPLWIAAVVLAIFAVAFTGLGVRVMLDRRRASP